ncbi:MAG: hypothetical protein RR636_12540 [Clostridium sp.]|uniref:hypothetical protein n=1 Tax=Clostridium sp. TaxID=1506 RepID=UPI00306455BE
MENFTVIKIINIICYLLAAGFIVVGQIGFKKLEKEFRKSNSDISKEERKKRLPYMISAEERKKRLPYLICTLIGYSIPLITLTISILVMFNIV